MRIRDLPVQGKLLLIIGSTLWLAFAFKLSIDKLGNPFHLAERELQEFWLGMFGLGVMPISILLMCIRDK